MSPRVASQARQATTTPKSVKVQDIHTAKKQKLSQTSNTSKKGLGALISQNGSGKKTATPAVNGDKDTIRLHKFDEGQAVIGDAAGADVDMEDPAGDVSSNEVEDEEISADEDFKKAHSTKKAQVNGLRKSSKKSQDQALSSATLLSEHTRNGVVDGEDEEDEEADEEPTFGELLENTTIDVDHELAVQDPTSQTLAARSSSQAMTIPSAGSLGTVLTQALRTNDKTMLESCFQINDLDSVRSTIARLESPLVAGLLQRLAERIHKKPGRASNLMVWVQWSLVAHGGYLASQPDVTRKLQDLHRVIKERANGLQPLLSLKGKLDMLAAQLDLRRNMQRSMAIGEDDDEIKIYVEGDESDSENEKAPTKSRGAKGRQPTDISLSDDSGDDGLDMPAVDDLDDAEEQSDESEGLLDDEAEETDRDSGDDMSDVESDEEEDDEDDEDISESEEETSRPLKRARGAASSAARK